MPSLCLNSKSEFILLRPCKCSSEKNDFFFSWYSCQVVDKVIHMCDASSLVPIAYTAAQFMEEVTLSAVTHESSHDYTERDKKKGHIHLPGASYLTVTFDSRLEPGSCLSKIVMLSLTCWNTMIGLVELILIWFLGLKTSWELHFMPLPSSWLSRTMKAQDTMKDCFLKDGKYLPTSNVFLKMESICLHVDLHYSRLSVDTKEKRDIAHTFPMENVGSRPSHSQ